MHAEAYAWIAAHATDQPVSVLDIGGRNVNGTPRPLFPNATSYTVLDILPGEGVDIVADAATWEPDREYEVLVAAECFEHAEAWREICQTAYRACAGGGKFIITTAAPGRAVHSGVDGGPILHPGEHYGNISADELREALLDAGWSSVLVHTLDSSSDTRAVANK